MSYLLIRHKVQNFDTWKRAYDDHRVARDELRLELLGGIFLVVLRRPLARSLGQCMLPCLEPGIPTGSDARRCIRITRSSGLPHSILRPLRVNGETDTTRAGD